MQHELLPYLKENYKSYIFIENQKYDIIKLITKIGYIMIASKCQIISTNDNYGCDCVIIKNKFHYSKEK